MIKAAVSSYHPVEDNHGKSYTVFVIEIYHLGRLRRTEKRYTAFHTLHKQVIHHGVACQQAEVTRSVSACGAYGRTQALYRFTVRNWNPRVLEHRRQGLEHYLKAVLKLNPVPKSVISFLGIANLMQNENTESSLSLLNCETTTTTHQPIVTFVSDPFLTSKTYSGSLLKDMVVEGVLLGLYEGTENGVK